MLPGFDNKTAPLSDKVTWNTVNGLKVGCIERFADKGAVVRLDNGKVVICAESSLKKIYHE